MSAEQRLPAAPTPAELDVLQGQPERWLDVARAVAARYSAAPVRAAGTSTVLVGLVGSELVVKLYAPFLRDHFDFERTMLGHLQGRLTLPTPHLLDSGEHQGWPFLVMTQLPGITLDVAWPTLTEPQRLAALQAIGRTAAEVHALPLGPIPALTPAWPAFLQQQRERCHHRQQRTGLPAHLLAQLAAFLEGPLPEPGPDVILTGEYTPFNLMSEHGALSGMFDFGDGLVGPRAYDWLGPMCFLAAGHEARLDAFFEGYHGKPFDRALREPLLRQLLLHRYSCLPAQIALPGWQQAGGFEALAALIWP
jgi:hygromycin-B 7''-O-kinase